MLSHLYPTRRRDKNIGLIRGVIMASSESAFRDGHKAFVDGLHPSLFSELDFMEETVPQAMLARARSHVDGLFDESLPALLRMRAAQFDVSDDALCADVYENRDAYLAITGDAACAEALGAERVARIQAALVAPAPKVNPPVLEADTLRDTLKSLRDAGSVPLAIQVALQNAALVHLDHLPSRVRAKAWIREACGGHLPQIRVSRDQPDMKAALSVRLEALEAQAAGYRLGHVAAVVGTARRFLETHDLASMRGFDGELSAGVGPCGNCSMRFASTALSVVDPSIGFDANSDFIRLPIFNIADCPFCGYSARLCIPLMFYAPQRAQIVYCVPLMPGQDKETAREITRPILEHFWKRYRERLSKEAVSAFEQATELVTYSIPEFLFTVQMGTTSPEWHSFLWVRLFDGSWMASDPTKHAMISMTDAEHADIRTMLGDTGDALGQEQDESPPDSPPTQGSIPSAMAAFKAGQFDLARQELEACLTREPGNTIARRNLAVVYLKLGRREDARRILSPEASTGEVKHA